MNHSPADIVRTLLIAKGVGTDPDSANPVWPIFADREPTSPDNVITVYNTPGRYNGRVMQGEVQGPEGIQVRIRAANSAKGWLKADEVHTMMAEGVLRDIVTIGAARYLVQAISRIGDVLPLGKESPTSQRNIFTINAVVTVTQCS